MEKVSLDSLGVAIGKCFTGNAGYESVFKCIPLGRVDNKTTKDIIAECNGKIVLVRIEPINNDFSKTPYLAVKEKRLPEIRVNFQKNENGKYYIENLAVDYKNIIDIKISCDADFKIVLY